MVCQGTSDDETCPWLGHQREESHQMLVANEDTKKADDKEAPVRSLVWILVAVWSAVFLGALDGMLPHSSVSTRRSYIYVTAGTIVATLLSDRKSVV